LQGLLPAFSHARGAVQRGLLAVINGPFDIWGKTRPTDYPHHFSTGKFMLPVDFSVEKKRPKRDRIFLVHTPWISFSQVRSHAVGCAPGLSTP
jgi:hypothetical protein